MKFFMLILCLSFSFVSGAYAWSDPLVWKELNLDISKKQALKILNENCSHVETKVKDKQSISTSPIIYASATGCGKYLDRVLEKVIVVFKGKIFFNVATLTLHFPHSKESFNYFVKYFDETGLLEDLKQAYGTYDNLCPNISTFIKLCEHEFSYSLEDRNITISHMTISDEEETTTIQDLLTGKILITKRTMTEERKKVFVQETKIAFYSGKVSPESESGYSD